MNFKGILILSLLCSFTAYAQDSVDAHGFHIAPSDGSLSDGLSTWNSSPHNANSFSLSSTFEYASKPLTYFSVTDDDLSSSYLIDDLTALNMGLFYAPNRNFAITASAPIYLDVDGQGGDYGLGIGDVRLAAPIRLTSPTPQRDGSDLSVSVVPLLDIPMGYSQELSLEGLSGGGLTAISIEDERWSASLNAGLYFSPEIQVINLDGGMRLLTAASGSYSLTRDMALRGEILFNPDMSKNLISLSDSPMESILSLRGYSGDYIGWTFGGATNIISGSGAANWRMFGGLDIGFGSGRRAEDEEHSVGITIATTDEAGNELPPSTVCIENDEISMCSDIVEQGESYEPFSITIPSDDHYTFRLVMPTTECESPNELVEVEEDRLILMEPIYFDYNKDRIKFPESTRILSALTETLMDNPDLLVVSVEGHTDDRGSDSFNLDLSQRRANSVVRYLTNHGIERDRLTSVGYGERRLLNEDCNLDEECHAVNRRVEFAIIDRE